MTKDLTNACAEFDRTAVAAFLQSGNRKELRKALLEFGLRHGNPENVARLEAAKAAKAKIDAEIANS